MKKLILLICLMTGLTSLAQTNYVKNAELLISAKRAIEKNETENALLFYKEAFKLSEDVELSDYFYAVKCAAKLNNESTLKTLLIKAIEEKKASKESLKSLTDDLFYQKNLDSILPNYDAYLNNYYKNIKDPIVYHQLQKLLQRDQDMRKLNDYYLGVNEKEQEAAFDAYLKAQAEKDTIAQKKYRAVLFPEVIEAHDIYKTKVITYTDSLNVTELIKITKKHGWQKEAWLILWHQRGTYGEKNWVWNYFKPVIDKEINEGKLAPYFWAIFDDISSLMKTGESIYGYHPGKVNAETVNRNRKQIGLPILTDKEITQRNTRRDKGRIF